jgi:23S rRNA (uracil1939-C5)-methyltransferase
VSEGAPASPAPVRLTIDSIAAGGDGVARHEGLVVFVPRSAPGDVVQAAVTVQGRFARGQLVAIERPSAQRVEPPCVHYVRDRCGGCQLQHLAYGAQLAAKAGIVRDGFERIGRRAVTAPGVRASEPQWRYRRKLTLAMRRLRDGRWIAGLHPHDSPAWVFDLADCPITDERVLATWAELRAAFALLPPGATRLRGAVLGFDDGGASFVLEGGTRWPRAREFFDAVPSLVALWWEPERGPRRLVASRERSGEPTTGFVQVNPAMAGRLAADVVARVRAHAPRRVVDAYAGAGDVAYELAKGGAVQVTAIELDAAQTVWSQARLPRGSRAISGLVEDLLPQALPADVVILNPPRAGVDERVTATLAAATPRPRAIVYVSCNPATLARDVGRLPGWRVAHLESYDMFPQTAHVETLCELVPEDA